MPGTSPGMTVSGQGGLRQRPQFTGGGDHIAKRRHGFLPAAGLEAAIGIDPDLVVVEHVAARLERGAISPTAGTRGEWMS